MTHGRFGIQRRVLGSVTELVLQGSTLPLFIVHPSEPVGRTQSGLVARDQRLPRFTSRDRLRRVQAVINERWVNAEG
jgi:hypothetical protein